MSRCDECNRWTFDYRDWLPWWLVPRFLAGRQNFGGECLVCLETNVDSYYTCDHDWRPAPLNTSTTAPFVPRSGDEMCVKCRALKLALAPPLSQLGSDGGGAAQ